MKAEGEITYYNILETLFSEIPEFHSINMDKKWHEMDQGEKASLDPHMQYRVLADFAHYIVEELHQLEAKGKLSQSEKNMLDRAYSFINRAYKSTDDNVVNIIQVQVLELFDNYRELFPFITSRLCEEARMCLEHLW